MITGDLDVQLTRSLNAMAAGGDLPARAIRPASGTWRPDPAGDPATFATSLPFEVGRAADRPAAQLAAALAADLARVPWIDQALVTGSGYVSVTVTAFALAEVAMRIVSAGPGCARSTALAGICVTVPPWPDLAAAPSWHDAWAAQAAAMHARMAMAAGAHATSGLGSERAALPALESGPRRSAVAEAVEYLGADVIRYRLARTLPSHRDRAQGAADTGREEYDRVQRAHAEAVSTLRWAVDLGVDRADPASGLPIALPGDEERRLLGLLSWLPERVASAARTTRPHEVPRFLEDVAKAWTACWLARPALPFGGKAASRDPDVQASRLLLADAARTVIATGLALCGLPARDRI